MDFTSGILDKATSTVEVMTQTKRQHHSVGRPAGSVAGLIGIKPTDHHGDKATHRGEQSSRVNQADSLPIMYFLTFSAFVRLPVLRGNGPLLNPKLRFIQRVRGSLSAAIDGWEASPGMPVGCESWPSSVTLTLAGFQPATRLGYK